MFRQKCRRHKQITEQYIMGRKIGQGKFGKVFRVKKKGSNQQFVLKTICCPCQAAREAALQQIQILSLLEHQHIVKVFEYYELTIGCNTLKPYYEVGFIIESGLFSLESCIKDPAYFYDETDMKKFLAKFIEVGAYLQTHGLVHRDIKPANIIIFGPNLDFKIADFGLSCHASKRTKGFAGTLHYASPALKIFSEHGDRRHSPFTDAFKDDVYSLGVTATQMLKKLSQPPSHLLIRFIDQMLQHQERYRPSFLQLMHHDLVRAQFSSSQEAAHSHQESPSRPSCGAHQQNLQVEQIKTHRIVEDNQIQQQNFQTIQMKTNPVQLVKKIKLKGLEIRTVCRIDSRYILCGTSDGNLFLVDIEKQTKIVLSFNHRGYVAQVRLDRQGNIWSAGGDGLIYFVERKNFLDAIENGIQSVKICKKSLFGKDIQIIFDRLIIPEQTYQIIQATHRTSISTFLCIDRQNYAVGYCDGSISGQWRGMSFSYHIHQQPIISLKIFRQQLYSSDYAGYLKSYHLNNRIISKNIEKFDQQMINFNIFSHRDGYNVQAISSKGQYNSISVTLHQKNLIQSVLPQRDIMAVEFNSKGQYMALTSSGKLIKQGFNIVFDSQDKIGWCCMQISAQEIIIASFDGGLAVFNFQN